MLTFRAACAADYPLLEQFKRATFADNSPGIVTFDQAFGPQNPYDAFLARHQRADPLCVTIVIQGDDIIGHIEMGQREGDAPHEGYVFNYYLKPEHRGKGLGAQLDAYACAHLRAQGRTLARLRTNGDNIPVIAFYTRAGWRVVGPSSPPPIVLLEKQL